MIERQKRIFREIVANYFGVSILELSKITNVSDKTILSDIKELESILKDYNLSFIKKDSIVSIPFEEKSLFLMHISRLLQMKIRIKSYQNRQIEKLAY